MVHANILVAGLDKFQQPRPENLKLHHAFGEMRHKRSLLLFQPRNMSVAEERNAVRAEANDLVYGVREALSTLIRQSINQIHIDAVEAKLASSDDQVARHLEWLNTVHRLLHVRMKILDAHAQAIEPHPSNSL